MYLNFMGKVWIGWPAKLTSMYSFFPVGFLQKFLYEICLNFYSACYFYQNCCHSNQKHVSCKMWNANQMHVSCKMWNAKISKLFWQIVYLYHKDTNSNNHFCAPSVVGCIIEHLRLVNVINNSCLLLKLKSSISISTKLG